MTNWEKRILQLIRKQNPEDPLRYVRNIVKVYAREKLDQKIVHCKQCSIGQEAPRTVTYGNVNAPVMVITSMALPSQRDVAYPLEGTETWNIVQSTLIDSGISLQNCFFINSVNCCPRMKIENNVICRIPNLEEEKNCKSYLISAIEIVQPQCLLVLGNIALNSLVKANLNQVRGKILDIMGVPAVTTFNPDYILSCQKESSDIYECEKNIFINDFKKVASLIQQRKE